MEFAVEGDADGGPAVRLDHERFAYAGKFVMTNTGKAVAREGGEIVAVASFNRDRTDDGTAWLRYVTVRADRRGEGIGPRLLAFLADRLLESFEGVRIAVNNPYAYEALYKAGFGYTGERTGLAELVLERPNGRRTARYREGLEAYGERELSEDERSFLDARIDGEPPDRVTTGE